LQPAANAVQWLLLDLNAFFASCEQQKNPRPGRPAGHRRADARRNLPPRSPTNAAKAFGIKTGTLVRDARRLCPAHLRHKAGAI
jgi:DNA polymerase-4